MKCFATVERGAPFCPECGVPIGNTDGSDSEIYPMLARANLLRMRGEYQQAEEVCLKILKRYPNNSTANTLLGDICGERGNLEHAAEWYEMALDVSPDSKVDREKLAAVRQRIKEREAAATAAQIGLPPARGRGLQIAGILVLVAAVAGGAYLFGANAPRPTEPKVVDVSGGVPSSGPLPVDRKAGAVELRAWIDEATTLRTRSLLGEDGKSVLDAWEHPASGQLLITLSADAQTDVRGFSAVIGAKLLIGGSAPSVIIRSIQHGQVVFVGRVERENLEALVASAAPGADPLGSPDAADKLLGPGEWPKREGTESSTETGETTRSGDNPAEGPSDASGESPNTTNGGTGT